MKILHVITGLNVGGAETMLGRLLESGGPSPAFDQQVVTLMAPGVAGRRIEAAGTRVHSLGMRGGVPSIAAALGLGRLTREIRPDLIMGWMHHGNVAATVAAAMAPGRPGLVWNVRHALDGYRLEKPLSRLMLRAGAWLSARPAAIVYNSRVACRQYRAFGYRPRQDLVIPNGFDRTAFRDRAEARRKLGQEFGIAAGRVVIGMIARNHPMKDVANLLAAFAKVRARAPDAHLLVVGEGMDAPAAEIDAHYAALPAGSWTRCGHRSDVATWLAGLGILALPSAWGEGFPNIVGEAMACGVPCVATDVGDTSWAIGATGRIVAPRDAAALADALLDLVAIGAEGRAALGRAASDRVEAHFTLAAVARRYAALFLEHGAKPHAVAAPATFDTMAGSAP